MEASLLARDISWLFDRLFFYQLTNSIYLYIHSILLDIITLFCAYIQLSAHSLKMHKTLNDKPSNVKQEVPKFNLITFRLGSF